MGLFSSVLGAFKAGAATIALDALAALINGPKPQKAAELKNKSFRSDAYGQPWPRCRGTVRLQGKEIWATGIRTSIWKTTSGGIFGIGSTSVYYNKYSRSNFIGFGKKLGGGAAVDILRIWADGKYLFNKRVSNASITGSVTLATTSGANLQGSQFMQIVVASGASLTFNAGDDIVVLSSADPYPYTVQTNITATGPTTISVPVWPPLRQDFLGGNAIGVPGITSAPYDLSSFDPNPHDGSHTAGGYACPSGGITFYLGSDTQQPDPTILQQLGAGNVPGYRGLVGVSIHDLQLANYGDHPPAITAEIAFDVASPLYPVVGPIANLPMRVFDSLNADQTVLPFSGTSSLFIQNPLITLPYVWVVSGDNVAHDSSYGRMLYRVNTQTNLVEATYDDPTAGIWGNWLADADGFVYYVRSTGLNQYAMFKVDGLAMTSLGNYGAPNAAEGNLNPPSGMYAFDTFPSLFGNNVQVRMISAMGNFGGIVFLDRKYMLPLGSSNQAGLYTVITGYDVHGTAQIAVGDIIQAGFGSIFTVNTPYSGSGAQIAGDAMAVDQNGDIWTLQKDTLCHYDCQFASSVDLQTLQPILSPPSFARTDYVVNTVATNGGALFYNFGDNSIILFGNMAIGKFDIATGAIVLTNSPVSAQSVSADIDILGTLIVGNGEDNYFRVDTSTLAVTNTYYVPNWIGAAPAHGTYDQATDSVWYNSNGQLYRLYLDRGNGSGISLASIVSSLMTDAGYV